MSKLNRIVSRRNARIALIAVGVASSAYGQTWTGLGGNGQFNTGANWLPTGVPTSSSTTSLTFTGSTAITANQNISASFTLNSFTNSNSASTTISGNTLSFAGTTPTILQGGLGGLNFTGPVAFAADTTVAGTGTGVVSLSGVLSGTGGLVKANSGNLTLNPAGNSTIGFFAANAGTTAFTGGSVTFTTTAAAGLNGTFLPNAGLALGNASGQSAVVNVSGGARISNGNVYVGNAPGSSGILNVSGTGSFVGTATTTFNQGRFGFYNGTGVINVSGGASVFGGSLENRGDGSHGTINFTGSGTSGTFNQIIAGRSSNSSMAINVGVGTTLSSVASAANAGSGVVSIGDAAGSVVSVNIAGAVNLVTQSTTNSGANSTVNFTIASTGSVTAANFGLGMGGSSVFNGLIDGGTLNVGGAYYTGLGGIYSNTDSTGAVQNLTVRNGGKIVESTSGTYPFAIGVNFGATFITGSSGGSNLTVTGTGSAVSANGLDLAYGCPASLSIENGGSFTAGYPVIGTNAAGGQSVFGNTGSAAIVNISGANSVFRQTAGATFVAADSASTAVITVANGGSLVTTQLQISTNGGSDSGSSTLAVSGGSTVTVNGGMFIGSVATVTATGGSLIQASLLSSGGDGTSAVVQVDASSLIYTPNFFVAARPFKVVGLGGGTSTFSPTSVIAGTITTGYSSTSSATGVLDLTNTSAIDINDSLATVTAELAAYFNGGHTVGIGSSTAGALTSDPRDLLATLGVRANDDGTGTLVFATAAGLTLTSTSVIIKYTYIGDTDLNGVVNGADLADLLAGMNSGGTLKGWVNGDLNYDGAIDSTDLALLLNSLKNQGSSFGSPVGPSGAVPEPMAIAPVMGLALLAGRRRR